MADLANGHPTPLSHIVKNQSYSQPTLCYTRSAPRSFFPPQKHSSRTDLELQPSILGPVCYRLSHHC